MRPQNPSVVTNPAHLANSVYKTLRGNVSMGSALDYDAVGQPASFTQDNTDGVMIRVGSSGNPFSLPNFWAGSNVDTTIDHNLGRVPIGYYVTKKDRTCDVYDGTLVATEQEITLKNTDGNADTVIYIF